MNMLKPLALLAFGVSLVHASAGNQNRPAVPATCPPVDEAAKDPGFFLFRAQLQVAVARRDAQAVLKVTSPDVRISLGPDDGFDSFKRKLSNPQDEIWSEMATALALGGSFDTPSAFTAPYTFRCGGGYEWLAVIGSDVRVRSEPAMDARVISSVSFAVLKGRLATTKSGWADVELPDSRKGYIDAEFVRSPLDYRAYFEKSDRFWLLKAFLAGD